MIVCPNCSGTRWQGGPEGGGSQNIRCPGCGKKYCYHGMGPLTPKDEIDNDDAYYSTKWQDTNPQKPRDPDDYLPWVPWFAWRPVRVCGKFVWLDTVSRRTFKLREPEPGEPGAFITHGWEYGPIQNILSQPR